MSNRHHSSSRRQQRFTKWSCFKPADKPSMKHETQALHALRERSSALAVPSQCVLRYLRRLVDSRPYVPVRGFETQSELEELHKVGLWPPQTCVSARMEEKKKTKTGAVEEDGVQVFTAEIKERKKRKRRVSEYEQKMTEACQEWYAERRKGELPVACDWGNWRETTTESRDAANRPSLIDHRNSILTYRTSRFMRTSTAAINTRMKVIPKEECELVARRMGDGNRTQNYRSSIRLFHDLVYPDRTPTIECLNECIQAYIGAGEIEHARAVYAKYRPLAGYNARTMQLLLRTLLSRSKIEPAELLVKTVADSSNLPRVSSAQATRRLKRLSDGQGLEVKKEKEPATMIENAIIEKTQPSWKAWSADEGWTSLFSTYLRGVQTITKSTNEIKKALEWITSITPSDITVSGYYARTVKDFMKHGNVEEASYWLKHVRALGLDIKVDEYEIFLIVHAKNGDWEALQALITRIKNQGVTIDTRRMNHVLKIASRTSPSSMLYHLASRLEARWDIATYNIVLKTTLFDLYGPTLEDRIGQLFAEMKKQRLGPDKYTAAAFISYLSIVQHARTDFLRRFVSRLQEIDPNSANFWTRQIVRSHTAREFDRSYKGNVLPHHSDILDTKAYSLHISALLKQNEPREALDLFYTAIDCKITPIFPLVNMAIQAVNLIALKSPKTAKLPAWHLSLEEDFRRVSQIAKEHNLDFANKPKLYENLFSIYRTARGQPLFPTSDPYDVPTEKDVMDIYRFYDSLEIPLRHHALISIAHRLDRQGKALDAIKLVRAVGLSEYANRKPFDVVCMTVLLKCYSDLKDIQGINWVVTDMERRDVLPDVQFMRILRHVKNAEGLEKRCEQLQALQQQKTERMAGLFLKLMKDGQLGLCRDQMSSEKELGEEGEHSVEQDVAKVEFL